MLDYIFTDEGQMIANMGPEGVGWTKPGPGDVALDASTQAAVQADPAERRPEEHQLGRAGAVQQHAGVPERRRSCRPTSTPGAGYERRLFEATKLYEGHEDKAQ